MPRWVRPIGLGLAMIALLLIMAGRQSPGAAWMAKAGMVCAVASVALLIANLVMQFRNPKR